MLDEDVLGRRTDTCMTAGGQTKCGIARVFSVFGPTVPGTSTGIVLGTVLDRTRTG